MRQVWKRNTFSSIEDVRLKLKNEDYLTFAFVRNPIDRWNWQCFCDVLNTVVLQMVICILGLHQPMKTKCSGKTLKTSQNQREHFQRWFHICRLLFAGKIEMQPRLTSTWNHLMQGIKNCLLFHCTLTLNVMLVSGVHFVHWIMTSLATRKLLRRMLLTFW